MKSKRTFNRIKSAKRRALREIIVLTDKAADADLKMAAAASKYKERFGSTVAQDVEEFNLAGDW